MQIPQSVIDNVVERADIVDVIGKHLKLKRSGANYFACCPFHNEKTPSFSVSSVKQIYHCFGCGESGNSISFIMKHLGLDFISALKNLADQYGVVIPDDNNQSHLSKEQKEQYKQYKLDIHETIAKSVAYYSKQLTTSNYAQHYLQNRGLSDQIINLFELGYAPNSFTNLANVFADYAKNEFLTASGLVVQTEEGKRYDRFRERIIFPIKNIKGEVIGFGGRIITKGEPKYLNSPETELFNKSKELYGLFEARKSIRELNQVIVVEGYMDVIALNQYGIANVVATMGTAITEEHIKQLFRMCDNICYAFDGDNAGKKAAWRALERSLSHVTDLKAANFLFLPENHDPDSYIRQYGINEFKDKLTRSRVGVITFLLNQLVAEVAINTDEGKARLISMVKPYLEQIKAIALVVILKKQLAAIVDLEPSVVESILNNRSRFAFFNKKIKHIDSAYKSQLNRQPLDVQGLQGIVFALFNEPKLSREFPVPEVEVLAKLDPDLSELFRLISYLEVHCDNFADIIISDLVNYTDFKHINLVHIYERVRIEKEHYQNVFSLNVTGYREKLKKLVYDKKRPRMPKLD